MKARTVSISVALMATAATVCLLLSVYCRDALRPGDPQIPRELIAAYDSYTTSQSRLEYVESLFLANRTDEAYQIAMLRLNREEDDLGGLLLKLECDIAAIRVKDIVDTIDRIHPILAGMNKDAIGGKRDEVLKSLEFLKRGVEAMSDQQIKEESGRKKKRGPESMCYLRELESLAKEGHF